MKKEATDYGAVGLNSLFNHIKNHFDTKLQGLPEDHPHVKMWNGIKPLLSVTHPSGGTGLMQHMDNWVHKNVMPQSLETGYKNMYGEQPKSSTAPKTVHPTYTASIINKAAALMPYLNDVYAAEPVQYRFALAVEAAMELADAPAAPEAAAPEAPGAAPKQRKNRELMDPADLVKHVDPKFWHGFMNDLGQSHPEISKLMQMNPERGAEVAKGMASGNYPGEFFGGNSAPGGPKFTMPTSIYARIPKDPARSQKFIQKYLDDYALKAKDFTNKLRSGGETEAPVSRETFDKLRNQLNNVSDTEGDRPSANNGALPTFDIPQNTKGVPADKKQSISDIVNNLRQNHPNTDEAKTLMERFHQITPHLDDAGRKKLLPTDYHGLSDAMGRALQKQERSRNAVDVMDDFSQQPEDTSVQRRLDKDTDRINKRPVNEEEDSELPTNNERDELRQTLRRQKNPAMGAVGDEMNKSKDEQLADQIKENDRRASKVNEILTITAGFSPDEFELAAEALLDMGYTDNDIISAYALQKQAEDDSDINGSTGAVLDVAEKFGPVDDDRAHGLPGKKASQLLKEALNPGGVNFDVAGNGAQIPNPMNRRREEQPAANAPAKQTKRTPSFEELYPSLSQQPKKPSKLDMIRDFLGQIKNDDGASPAAEFGKGVKDYFNVGYKGKHDAPAEPNKIQKFLDWLKGVHQKSAPQPQAPAPAPAGPSLADKTRQLVHQDRKEQQDQNMFNSADTALDHIKRLEQMHGVNTALAAKDITSLLSVALQEEDDYNNIRIAMNAAGIADEAMLQALS